MDVGSGSSGSRMGKSKLLIGISALIAVAVLVTALVLASGMWVPSCGPGSTDRTPDDNAGLVDEDTAEKVDQPRVFSGPASDFILSGSVMGTDWNATQMILNTSSELTTVDAIYRTVMSDATISFSQNNSTGHLHYWVDVSVIVFNTADNASTFYGNRTEIHPQDDSRIKPEYRPSYPVLIANVSIGDRCVIHDWPRITLGHEAKALYFVNKNVVCMIAYHDATSYDPLPNELLIDLANKIDAKIVESLDQSDSS